MQLTKAVIKNFRNIKDLSFDFTKTTAIVGKNHIGKTNTLHAVYWVLADALLDNSKEFDSITPTDDRRATTMVELTFDDGFKVAKTYKEIWQKIRGTSSERLTGHDTTYIINDITYKRISEAVAVIRKQILGEETENKSVDLIKALINPLYLFLQEDWKKARTFITSLVKIKSDEEIIAEEAKFKDISADLSKYNNKTDVLMRYYSEKIETANKEIKQSDILIEDYNKQISENKVTDEEVMTAQSEKDKYNADLIAIKKGDVDTRVKALEDAKREVAREISDIENGLREKKAKAEYENYQQRSALLDRSNELRTTLHSKRGELGIHNALEEQLTAQQDKLKRLNKTRENYLEQYKKIKAETFSFDKKVCPHCGMQLNEEEEEKALQEFNSSKEMRLGIVANNGKNNNYEISKVEAEIEQTKRSLAEIDINALRAEIERLDAEKVKLDAEINKIPLTVNDFIPANDESWLKANEKLKELNRNINEANIASTANVQSAINDYKLANAKVQEHFSEIERKKLICEINQKNLNNEETKRMASTADLTKYEKLKLILKDFILAKLAMINESTKQIFPDIEFTLVEQNITEGSFDEVCYPLIVGKKTPFANGSNSERILTGIHIINDLHRFLGIQPLPIIFDEGETLDDFSVSEIVTDNQVIYSKVDSRFAIDYPTAI